MLFNQVQGFSHLAELLPGFLQVFFALNVEVNVLPCYLVSDPAAWCIILLQDNWHGLLV